jgi:hypothetical protein
MQQDMERFLNLKQVPARLTIEETAWFLGFSSHDIPILVARGFLRPLGHPAHNGQKFFLAATLDELRRDEKWFSKACDAIVEYWRRKNTRKAGRNGGHKVSSSVANAPQFADADS